MTKTPNQVKNSEIRIKYTPLLLAKRISPKEVAEKYNIPVQTVYSWTGNLKADAKKKGISEEALMFENSLKLLKSSSGRLSTERILEQARAEELTGDETIEALRLEFILDKALQGHKSLEKHADNISTLVVKTESMLSKDTTPKDLQSIANIMKQTSAMIAEAHGYNLINKGSGRNATKATETYEELASYGNTAHKPVSIKKA